MNLFSTIASAIPSTPSLSLSASPGAASASQGPSFGDTLMNALSDVNGLQNRAGAMAQDFAAGRAGDIHTVMIAGEQATLSLELATQVRNKAVEAYQNIMSIAM